MKTIVSIFLAVFGLLLAHAHTISLNYEWEFRTPDAQWQMVNVRRT